MSIQLPRAVFALMFLFAGTGVVDGQAQTNGEFLSFGDDNLDVAPSRSDEEPIVPWLATITPVGPRQIMDIVATAEGFLLATGEGVSRWKYVDDVPCYQDGIVGPHGSALGQCQRLLPDKKGGVWIAATGSIGYLAADSRTVRWYTTDDGLPERGVCDIALDAAGQRIWALGPAGLATTAIESVHWRTFKKNNLLDMQLHPFQPIVWCREASNSRCTCGLLVHSVSFDLSTEEFSFVPKSGSCAHAAPQIQFICPKSGWIWMSGQHDPNSIAASAFDPATGKVHNWPEKLHWQRARERVGSYYSDNMGQVVPTYDGTGDVWAASESGLWRYDFASNRWHGHSFVTNLLCGYAHVIWSHDRRTLYWACDGEYGTLDTKSGSHRSLWSIDNSGISGEEGPLQLSPDGRTLWHIGRWGVAVGDAKTNVARLLNDRAVLELDSAEFVRFDPIRKLAMIVTPRGLVITDYHGMPRSTLTSPHPRIANRVVQFLFAPDGSEVWSLTKDPSGMLMPAHVYFPKHQKWQRIPVAPSRGKFYDVLFSRATKAVWLLCKTERGDLWQRKSGTPTFTPLSPKLAKDISISDGNRMVSTPAGDELWILTGSDGIYRILLSDNTVTRYGKRGPAIKREGFTYRALAANNVETVVFAQDAQLAVCAVSEAGRNDSMSLIDRATNSTEHFTLDHSVKNLRVEQDDTTITVFYWEYPPQRFDTRLRKWLDDKLTATKEQKIIDYWPGYDKLDPIAIGKDRYLTTASYLTTRRYGFELIDGKGQLLDEDGLSPLPEDSNATNHLLAVIPGNDQECLCAVSVNGKSAIYRFEYATEEFHRVKEFVGTITAIGVAPDGRVWVGFGGRIVCFDRKTGEEFPLWPKGRLGVPTVAVIQELPESTFSGITSAPVHPKTSSGGKSGQDEGTVIKNRTD